VLAASSPRDWAVVARRVLARSGRDSRQLERHRARRVDIETPEPVPRQADGEIIGPGRSLCVTVLPGALVARTPRLNRFDHLV
jgi:diacylglycerol kinase family enzyme